MRRAIARLQTWWVRLFVVGVLVLVILDPPIPGRWDLLVVVGCYLLCLVRAPDPARDPVDLATPVTRTWVAINSPGTSVPSHGVKAYGQKYAVDLLQPEPDAPEKLGWGLRARRPETYPSFGRPVLSMAPGTVVRVQDTRRDHGSRHTWPLLIFMMTVEGFVRELIGVSGIYGNHVLVRHGDGAIAAYAHLRHGSAEVEVGDQVWAGQRLGAVGNTGNTSEPHLHVHLMDDEHPTAAAGIPMLWPDLVLDPAERDPRWSTGDPKPNALADFPENGQIFHAGPQDR